MRSPLDTLLDLFAVLRGAHAHSQHEEPGHYIDETGILRGPLAVLKLCHPSWRYRSLTTDGPRVIVSHYTATKAGTAKTMHRRRTRKRRNSDRAASWHFTVEADGKIWQMAPCTVGTWHAGGTKWRFKDEADKKHRANFCSVGIEYIGHGKSFTEAQIEAGRVLHEALADAYDIDAVGAAVDHSEIDPKRRRDAGPVWGEIRAGILAEVYGEELLAVG